VVRTVFGAARVPGASAPFDTLHARLTYPARPPSDDGQRNSGLLDADPSGGPYPVVVFHGGANCGPEGYAWLAARLTRVGVVTLTFTWVAEVPPGSVPALLAGVEERTMRPGRPPTGPSPTLTAARRVIADLGHRGPLAGLLDDRRVILGGHSAGGREALVGADAARHPGVIGAFSYAGHNAGPLAAGFEPGTMVDITATCPVLLIGGDADGVLRWSGRRYGSDAGPGAHPVERCFDESLARASGPAYLAMVTDASHFCLSHPHDPSTGRGFLEPDAPEDQSGPREIVARLIEDFVLSCVRCDAAPLLATLAGPGVRRSGVRPAPPNLGPELPPGSELLQ
jgi:dienelactone hydrolase